MLKVLVGVKTRTFSRRNFTWSPTISPLICPPTCSWCMSSLCGQTSRDSLPHHNIILAAFQTLFPSYPACLQTFSPYPTASTSPGLTCSPLGSPDPLFQCSAFGLTSRSFSSLVQLIPSYSAPSTTFSRSRSTSSPLDSTYLPSEPRVASRAGISTTRSFCSLP